MSEQRKIIKNTLAIYLPVFILIAIVAITIITVNESTEMKGHQNTAWQTVETQTANIDSTIQQISSDLALLANQHEVVKLWNSDETPTPEVLADLTAEFLNVSIYRELYDQVRLIDKNGMEIIRINFNDAHPAIVPQNKLQNKSGRYYFDDAIILNRGEVFVSPLDLNIEHGEIEQPLKPMIRFATPVFDQHGTKRGIVLLNYFGGKMIDHLSRKSEILANNQVMLLNTDGYWLKGPNPEDEWGFMYKDRTDRTFANAYPDAWDIIMRDESSQFKTPQGMFTFNTIYPLIEGQKSSTGSGEPFSASMIQLEAKEYYWKVVSFTPSNVLYAKQNSRRIYTALILATMSLATFFGMHRIITSVTLRQQAERALHLAYEELEQRVEERTLDLSQSEEKFRNLFETMAQGVVYQDASGQIFSANPAAERILGLTFDQMQGRNSTDPHWQAIHEDNSDFPGETHPAMVALKTGQPVYNVIMGVFHPEEEKHYWINVNANPQFKLGEKKPYQVYTTFNDITERKQAQKALQMAHDNLEYLVQQRTEELSTANIRLKELDQHKDKFIEDMSHELRTPLTNLNIYLDLLERGQPEKRSKYMDTLRQTTQRLIQLSEGILTITRLNLYHDDIEAVPLDLNNIIANVIQEQPHAADNAGLQLTFIPDVLLPPVLAERSQLYKVIANLLENSLNYTSEGQIQISTFFDESCQQICLQVTDAGIGIEEADLPFLFDRFYRGQNVGQSNIPGIGLGLAIVKEIVESYGGHVGVKNHKEQGSTFSVWLPVATE